MNMIRISEILELRFLFWLSYFPPSFECGVGATGEEDLKIIMQGPTSYSKIRGK